MSPPMSRPATKMATRFASSIAVTPSSKPITRPDAAGLSRLSNKMLVRSLVLTSLMSKGWLLKPSLAALHMITKSKSALLNADKNPLLNKLLRWTIYDHFCAGVNRHEVARSMAEVKRTGFQGIILGYAKEAILSNPDAGECFSGDGKYTQAHYDVIEEWKQGTLETLRMLEPGDFLALKGTGMGPVALDAMQAHEPMPPAVEAALDEVCLEAQKRGALIWMDAEQQVLQVGLDEWTIALMRKYNRNGQALMYNTIQGYLKGARANAQRHIRLAADEGWALGLKLVRGAYIENEVRALIHDTKEETDRSYNDVADMLISQRCPPGVAKFPDSHLFLATHNADSASQALTTHRQRSEQGLPTTNLQCGQLVGMADELSCELLQKREDIVQSSGLDKAQIPRIFKCLCWGSVAECVGFLYRRAVENRGAVERTHHMVDALKKELRRRVLG